MNLFEEGYRDIIRGVLKAHLYEGDSKDNQAYRSGVRTCRADCQSEEQEDEEGLEAELPTPPGEVNPIPDWKRRLIEFRAQVSGTPHASNFDVNSKPPEEQIRVEQSDRLPEPVPLIVPPVHEKKKTRKAKPVDADQGSLFA